MKHYDKSEQNSLFKILVVSGVLCVLSIWMVI